jgi:hypothetical protein
MASKKNPFEDKAGFHWRWPNIYITIKPLEERHFVTFAIIAIIVGMLLMAQRDPALWDVELFKTLLTAFSLTGFLNMVVSFHFSANKGDEKKSENTAAAFEAIRETARTAAGSTDQAAADAAARTADAALEQARQEGDVGR